MRRFIYTVGGKTVLFLLTMISMVLAVSFTVGALFMVDQGFYTMTKERRLHAYRQEIIAEDARDIVENTVLYGLIQETESFDWQLYDEDARVIAQSKNVSDEEKDATALTGTVYTFHFAVVPYQEEEYRSGYAYYYDPDDEQEFAEGTRLFTIVMTERGIIESLEPYYLMDWAVSFGYSMRYLAYPLVIVLALLGIASFIGLMCAAGHRIDTEELVPGSLYRVPFDLLFLISVLPVAVVVIILRKEVPEGLGKFIVYIGGGLVLLSLLLGLAMSLAVRVKTKTFPENTLIAMLIRGIGRFFAALYRGLKYLVQHIPLVWRTILVFLAVSVLEVICLIQCANRMDFEFLIVLWLVEKLIVLPVVLFAVIGLRRLLKGGEEIAGGRLDRKISEKGLAFDLKRHAENLNHISDTINEEVEERIRSERMKTELITNVSHDIKTPLTSIINYSDLIAREPSENAKITEYSEVLTRQSRKLKRLIEDLVEVSKANTGNLEINAVPCDVNVFLSQSAGEYEDRLQSSRLSAIVETQPEPVMILADPRRMWRVFDNLMSNACKYTQEGTRVYLSLEVIQGQACVTIKNVSREQLNISPEELTERFVRGDRSRNSEGNGLGLSIAKSLVELQGGTFTIQIDGDLFKVFMQFPLMKNEAPELTAEP